MRGLAIDCRYQVRENLIETPVFGYGAGSWSNFLGTISVDDSVRDPSGNPSLKIVAGSGAYEGAQLTVGALPLGTYTYSAWALFPSAHRFNLAGDAIGGFLTQAGTDAWHRYRYTGTRTAATTSKSVYLRSDAAGVTFWCSQIVLTEGTDLLDYFDGNSPSARWTGTPGASTSLCLIGPDGKPVGS